MKMQIDVEKLLQLVLREHLPSGPAALAAPWDQLARYCVLGMLVEATARDAAVGAAGARRDETLTIAGAVRLIEILARRAGEAVANSDPASALPADVLAAVRPLRADDVLAAARRRRGADDPVGAFVDACVYPAADVKDDGSPAELVPARAMYDAFVAWARTNAVRPLTEKRFALAMAGKGFEKRRVASGAQYLDVRLHHEPLPDDMPRPFRRR